MPIYLYKNPETGEVKEIIQTMSETHEYFEDGLEWKRIFLSPNASIDTKGVTDQQFMEKTGNMKGTLGEMMDYSEDLSKERASKSETGEDPVKRKFYNDYEKRVGKKHMADKKTKFETDRIKIDLD
jgi:hypothetical protein